MIPLVKDTFYHDVETRRALADFIMNATVLSMSTECRRLEESFAAKQERRHAVFVSSGSAANLILIQALLNLGRLRRGDAVGVSALTWATNIMPLVQLGLRPVVLDCELDTLNVSPAALRPQLDGLRALFLTNVLGL